MQETIVVSVKVAEIRPEYNNLKEWCQDQNNVYIARGGIVFIKDEQGNNKRYPPKDSIWANPFKVEKYPNENCVDLYREYITAKLNNGEISREELEKLRGKRLGCWCKKKNVEVPCHGDVILELLNQ